MIEPVNEQGVPINPGGTLQLAVEGANRWWSDFGAKHFDAEFGEGLSSNPLVQAAAVSGFLCGRLELEKARLSKWQRVLAQIKAGKDMGSIRVGGKDLTDLLTSE